MEKPPVRRVSKKDADAEDIRRLIDLGIVGLFAAIGTATRHPHWFKDAEDVEPICKPLTDMVASMPKRQLEAMKRYINPALFAIGCTMVVAPDIAQELEIRRKEDAERRRGHLELKNPNVERNRTSVQGAGASEHSDAITPPPDLLGASY